SHNSTGSPSIDSFISYDISRAHIDGKEDIQNTIFSDLGIRATRHRSSSFSQFQQISKTQNNRLAGVNISSNHVDEETIISPLILDKSEINYTKQINPVAQKLERKFSLPSSKHPHQDGIKEHIQIHLDGALPDVNTCHISPITKTPSPRHTASPIESATFSRRPLIRRQLSAAAAYPSTSQQLSFGIQPRKISLNRQDAIFYDHLTPTVSFPQILTVARSSPAGWLTPQPRNLMTAPHLSITTAADIVDHSSTLFSKGPGLSSGTWINASRDGVILSKGLYCSWQNIPNFCLPSIYASS
ncbi:unnamed protein product, partial [Protopolystoma xenopodis]